MIEFNEEALRDRLDAMPQVCRCLFALSCAERLFPLYRLYHKTTGRGDLRRVRLALNHLWAVGSSEVGSRGRGVADKVESLAPGENTKWHPLNPLAENAVFAVAYAGDCQVGDSTQNAVWAALQGSEAVDYAIRTVEDADFNEPGAEEVVRKSALVQGELGSQLRDITEAGSCDDSPRVIADCFKAFRSRAATEGQTLAKAIRSYPELMRIK